MKYLYLILFSLYSQNVLCQNYCNVVNDIIKRIYENIKKEDPSFADTLYIINEDSTLQIKNRTNYPIKIGFPFNKDTTITYCVHIIHKPKMKGKLLRIDTNTYGLTYKNKKTEGILYCGGGAEYTYIKKKRKFVFLKKYVYGI